MKDMDYILEKYKKYNIEYNFRTGVIYIKKKIPVEKFLKLKKDLLINKKYISDIIIEGR